MSDEYNLDDVLPGHKKENRRRDILNKLIEMEDEEPSYIKKQDSSESSSDSSSVNFLPSSLLKDNTKKRKKSKDYDPDAWFNDMMSTSSLKVNKSKSSAYSFFDENGFIGGKKKKKKKDKEKSELIDFNKEFEPEMALYRNLLVDQNRFTEDLQREYNSITSAKSSSRGITKQMSDLIENITEARTLSMQLVEKNVNAKKLIAELTMKQKKENGNSLDSENMSDFAANYLKQMINERQTLLSGGVGDNSVSDYSDEEMFDILSESLDTDNTLERSSDTDIYLKYENRNVEIFVEIPDDDLDRYRFVARDEEGIELDDYPLPNRTKISVNYSTNIATDEFGKKYKMILV